MSSISYAADSDGIATLTIDQPGKSMNVVGPEFVSELEAAIERAAGDVSVKASSSPPANRASSRAPT